MSTSESSETSYVRETCDRLLHLADKAASWYGCQFMEEVIQATVSENLQRYTSPRNRIITHKLFYARSGWIKSTMLGWVFQILNEPGEQRQAQFLNRPTKEAMRGSVVHRTDDQGDERVIFVAPYPLQFRYFLVDEWSSIAGKKQDEDYLTYVLTLIESGRGQVELVKNALVLVEERRQLEQEYKKYNLKFVAVQTYEYQAWPLWLVATNKEDSIHDEALTTRYDIVMPDRELNSVLINHIKNNKFNDDQELFSQFRKLLANQLPIPEDVIGKGPGDLVPDYLVTRYGPEFGTNLSVRTVRDTGAWVLCKRVLGYDIDDNQIDSYMKKKLAILEKILNGPREIIYQLIQEHKDGLTVKELVRELNLQDSTISYHLGKLINQRLVEMSQGKPPKYKWTGSKNLSEFLPSK